MTKKFNLFRKHYNNLKSDTYKSNTSFKYNSFEEDVSYDDYNDSLYLDHDINYDSYYDELYFCNKNNSVDYFYDFDDYDYIE